MLSCGDWPYVKWSVTVAVVVVMVVQVGGHAGGDRAGVAVVPDTSVVPGLANIVVHPRLTSNAITCSEPLRLESFFEFGGFGAPEVLELLAAAAAAIVKRF